MVGALVSTNFLRISELDTVLQFKRLFKFFSLLLLLGFLNGIMRIFLFKSQNFLGVVEDELVCASFFDTNNIFLIFTDSKYIFRTIIDTYSSIIIDSELLITIFPSACKKIFTLSIFVLICVEAKTRHF